MPKKIIFLAVLLTSLFIIGGILLASKITPSNLKSTDTAKLKILEPKSFDWGIIDIDGGNKEKKFTLKNTGSSHLEINNIKTSCMCTEAQVTIGTKQSPVFGMHTVSGWKGVIEPGEEATLNVVFDPAYHGPTGVGPITRLVSFKTNDSENSYVEIKLSGNVVKK